MRAIGKLRIPSVAGDPASAVEGEIWYNSFLDQIRYKTPDTPPVSISVGARFNDIGLNRWYMTQTGAPTTATATASRLFAVPFSLARYARLSGIAIDVATAWTTTGNVRVGLYYGDYTNTPTTLIADYGVVTATAGIKTWAMTQDLAAGSYFLVAANQGGTGATTGQFRASTGVHEGVGDTAATPSTAFFNGTLNCYYATATVAGALPASFGTIGGTTIGPRFAVKFSA